MSQRELTFEGEDRFNLEVMFPDERITQPRKERVVRRAREFRFEYLRNHPGILSSEQNRDVFLRDELRVHPLPQGKYKSLHHLMQNLENSKFWCTIRTLQDTDEIARGPHNPIYSSTKQRWVDDHLTIGEQQEIYAIAINQALYRPVAEGFPGFKRSHTILLEQLFENKKSPFNDLLNESTLKRLANSALFEELSCGGNYNKILENYGSILDPELFEKSSQFFDERNGLNQYSKFKFATGESIDNLSNYLDLSWETNPDMFKTPIIQKIVRSYLVHIIDLTDEEDPQYNKKEMALMTKKPWVNDFFNNDESVSKGMVQEVSRHLNVFSAHAFDFLISLPNPSRIFERSILNLSENQRGKLAKNYNLAFPIHLSDKYHSVMVDDLTKYQSSKEIVYRH